MKGGRIALRVFLSSRISNGLIVAVVGGQFGNQRRKRLERQYSYDWKFHHQRAEQPLTGQYLKFAIALR